MDNLRNQMAALMQGIATSAHERERVIGDIKEQTANMLRAFGRERTAMAKALKACLVGDRMSRSADVRAIRDNTSTMCEGFRQDQVRLRRSLRQSLDQSRETVVTFVASLRVDIAKERADFAKVHRHMAKAQRAGLTKDRRYRSRAVVELMKDFHVSRGKMAQELVESLAKSTQEIRYQVSGLKQFSPSLGDIRKSTGAFLQIPDTLLVTQAIEVVSAPIQTPSHGPSVPNQFAQLVAKREPKIHKKEPVIAKAVSVSARKTDKPREKMVSAPIQTPSRRPSVPNQFAQLIAKREPEIRKEGAVIAKAVSASTRKTKKPRKK